uniref:NAD(P)H-quinone oxidoreductase subunit 6, chloroplastic n=1 Tax=Mesotaenium endlicherianum TaxID=184485 RepID=A0A024B490_9VIRI|nr:subunit 6 of NADH-plastoquinone oxidoreductase [Mesotaenium endlicherianum]AHZ11172.1 subunit 6 of NADH-plastoquinone oxidoreductase [Mesotaenium endlicherianum]
MSTSKGGLVSGIHFSEPIQSSLFAFVSLGILTGAMGVVLLRRIIYSGLLLGFVFACVALLYLLLDADFVAAAQILIYVGAVNVLILFAIMLVSRPDPVIHVSWTSGQMLATGAALAMCVLFGLSILDAWPVLEASFKANQDVHSLGTHTNIRINSAQTIGLSLLSDLLVPFELLSLVLLVALVGAITIARKEHTSEQNVDPSL